MAHSESQPLFQGSSLNADSSQPTTTATTTTTTIVPKNLSIADTTSNSSSTITTTTSQQSQQQPQPVKKTLPHSRGEVGGEVGRRGSGSGRGSDSTTTSTSTTPSSLFLPLPPTTLTTLNNNSDSNTTTITDNNLSDKISLTLLLVSGKRHTFFFSPNDTVTTVINILFNDWPKEWAEETPAAASCLKIVYRGRFLDEGKTLEFNKIPCGQPTIAHLTIKDVMLQDNNDPKSSDNAPKCQCTVL
ncbi:hypothetical protein Glove_330g69 [Diversispora epigaea]|uniref:UBL3-like ubiquitin domain-containing protein n=1 Tax=Diversispora epigaea TaxID=1348612 RepID=A0A397HMS1_9GLOM|nr:hypothetical protein Glove_330g69 [Diversispora epigaea]